MKRTFAFGGIVATAGLLAAGLAAPAAADVPHDVAATPLANTNLAAQQVAAFWFGEARANLINATPYNVETKVVATKLKSVVPNGSDGKSGIVPAIGDEKKAASTSKNVNLPRTSGKVFFIGSDHQPHWCTGTSIQSAYHNMVATAGHCVYDTESNSATLSKWVFVPAYYQGKTPYGIFVGKQAFTHYDFDTFEDGDRDYAFVTVYNGVLPTSADSDGVYKVYETKKDAEDAKAALEDAKTTGYSRLHIEPVVDHDHLGFGPDKVTETVTWEAFHKFNWFTGLGETWKPAHAGTSFADVEITQAKFREPAGIQNDGDFYLSGDHKTLFYSKKVGDTWKYFARTFCVDYDVDYKLVGRVLSIGLVDAGRLGDRVGGQGLAYNQKIGGKVFVFGYPSGSHPDGNHAYSGQTLKWSYGKTFKASASAIKGEELVGVKSSFTGEGSIGSSWLLQYKNTRRLGYLNGVTIGVSDTDTNARFDTSVSPYFDGELFGVYSAAKNLWSGKIV